MGMFDHIKCDYPLPGQPLEVDCKPSFQTKDLDNDLLCFRISEAGELLDEENVLVGFTGEVNFYSCNICAADGRGSYTRNGEDREDSDYKALFIKGKLIYIEQTQYSRKPALNFKEWCQ
jgi:hypothetical protein